MHRKSFWQALRMERDRRTTDTATVLGLKDLMQRIAAELGTLGRTTVRLQESLNADMLEETNSEARKALQSLDSLTQSLQCLETAVLEVSIAPDRPDCVSLPGSLSGVFLEDLRMRLLDGKELGKPQNSFPPGSLDLL